MTDSENPRLLALREHCVKQDSASVTEEYPWGHPVWKVEGKMFAACSGNGGSVTVKATLDQQAGLIQHSAIRVADYVGRYGWVTIEVSNEETLELALDLVDKSFDMVKPKARNRQ